MATEVERAVAQQSVPIAHGIVRKLYLIWLSRAALVLGVILRLREWLYDRSLWLDEISVTNNIVTRGLAGLLKPLEANQAAPVGWLWAERLSIDLFGVHELSLRLVPMLGSLVSLAAFPFLARSTIGPVGEPAATLVFAASPAMIFYAAETKQYSSDAACVVLVMLATTLLLSRAPGIWSVLSWGVACAALCWFSFPAIVVSTGCALLLLVRWWHRRRALISLMVAGAVLGLSLLAEWQVSLRPLSQNHSLDTYWQHVKGYPPRPGGLGSDLSWLHSAGLAVLRNPGHFALPTLAVFLGLWGLIATVRRRVDIALLVTIPILAGVALGLAHRYPLSMRLATYLIPSVILLLTGGFAVLGTTWHNVGTSPRVRRNVAALVVVALACTAGPPVAAGMGKLFRPDDVTDGRGAVEYVAHHQHRGDLVLAEFWAVSAMDFYDQSFGVRRGGSFYFRRVRPGRCAADPLRSFVGRRVWLVFAHHASNQPANRTTVYLSHFRPYGTQIDSHQGAGDAGAYLLDLSRPPTTAQTPLVPSWVPNGCLTVT